MWVQITSFGQYIIFGQNKKENASHKTGIAGKYVLVHATIHRAIFLTFIEASLGSFGKPLTEFESIERNIWLMIEKEYTNQRQHTN